ncbi:hypothetical protein [Dactylosporangium darangshiense]|uniref:SMP-30/Gluconolactonase/LRE-like region domain-containing protein n=1 Tax=Dactylosporangium darangshiense TaxID=579108 RepID=A0ABP8CYK9_9ACTN
MSSTQWFAVPALGVDASGKLYAAWTDPGRHLNVARVVPDTCPTIGAEAAGPRFAYFNSAGKLVIDG